MKRPALLLLFLVSLEVEGATGWSHKAINIDHNYTRGENVLVGVLDTAVRCTHTELARRCQEWVPIGYEDGYYGDHGTHVASLIAGSGKAPPWIEFPGGVAPKAEIISYRVFYNSWSTSGGEFWISDEVEAEAVELGVSAGISVFNQSYGDYDEYGRASIPDAMLKIWRRHKKKLFVNAAGNDSMVLDPHKHKTLGNGNQLPILNDAGTSSCWLGFD